MNHHNQFPTTPDFVELGGETDGPFAAIRFEQEAQNQILGELALFDHLEGEELEQALAGQFVELSRMGELSGTDQLLAWARADEHQAKGGLVVEAMAGIEHMTDAERYRVCLAQAMWASYALGTPWSRPYENGGRLSQDVRPKPGSEAVVGSIGATPQEPHNEVLPGEDGKIIASEFSLLTAVHNSYSNTYTTVFDAQVAIADLQQSAPEAVAILADANRFQWNGTAIEQAGTSEHEHHRIPVLTPVFSEQDGQLLGYDLLADLDGETMQAIEGDTEAAQALALLKTAVIKTEIDYVVRDGTLFIWRNRRVLHGRKAVNDPKRHLVRTQIGEAEYADHDLVA